MVTGTIKVRRANRVLRVTPNELEKYLANGYTVIKEPILASQPSRKVVEEPKIKEPAEPVEEEVEIPKKKTTRRRK